jgi:hypothetical protein
MEIGSIADVCTALIAFVGVVVSVREYLRSNKLKRSSYLEPLIEKMKSPGISEIVYMFQYGQFDYKKEFHKSGEMERKVDKTLQYFSYLCYLREKNIISKGEFSFFELEISQSLRDPKLIDYLFNLYHFVCCVEGYNPNKDGIEKSVYSSLLKYAKRRGLIVESFFEKNAFLENDCYHHYLNY